MNEPKIVLNLDKVAQFTFVMDIANEKCWKMEQFNLEMARYLYIFTIQNISFLPHLPFLVINIYIYIHAYAIVNTNNDIVRT